MPTTQTLATLPDNIMTLPSPLTIVNSSRFLQRWLAAKPTHAPALEQLAELSLDQLDFGQLLNAQQQNNVSLPAAMRRLRNLLVAAIVQRALLDQVAVRQQYRELGFVGPQRHGVQRHHIGAV